ncbi:MAG: tRNA (guanosine(46)-N7)-methyltransferase TrmB [Bacilli bacterium]
MRPKFKSWAEPFINEHKEVMISETDIASYHDFDLEIGSGKGDFLVNMSKKFPSNVFVGVEKVITCCGFTAKKLVENEIENAKLFFGDANKLIPNIDSNSINHIFLNFSDPWPKRRHHKRRLTDVKFLSEYYRVLKDDGELIIKTDNEELFIYSINNLVKNKFEIVNITTDYTDIMEYDSITEYEDSFRKENIKINRLVAKKVLDL